MGIRVNDYLVTYLDTVDERLLAYLDEHNEMSDETIGRLRVCTSGLLAGWITPARVLEGWTDWFHLAPAFVPAYGPEHLEVLQSRTFEPSRRTSTCCCGSPKFPTLDHRISPGGERRGGLGVSLRDAHCITS